MPIISGLRRGRKEDEVSVTLWLCRDLGVSVDYVRPGQEREEVEVGGRQGKTSHIIGQVCLSGLDGKAA